MLLKIKKSLPKKSDFSNDRISQCFDKNIIVALIKLDNISSECFKKFNEIFYGKVQEFNLNQSICLKI